MRGWVRRAAVGLVAVVACALALVAYDVLPPVSVHHGMSTNLHLPASIDIGKCWLGYIPW